MHVSIDVELADEVDEYRGSLEFPPSRSDLVTVALRDYLKRKKAKGK